MAMRIYIYNIHYKYIYIYIINININIYTHYFGDFLSSKIMTPCYSDHSPFCDVFFSRVPLLPTDSHDKM